MLTATKRRIHTLPFPRGLQLVGHNVVNQSPTSPTSSVHRPAPCIARSYGHLLESTSVGIDRDRSHEPNNQNTATRQGPLRLRDGYEKQRTTTVIIIASRGTSHSPFHFVAIRMAFWALPFSMEDALPAHPRSNPNAVRL